MRARVSGQGAVAEAARAALAALGWRVDGADDARLLVIVPPAGARNLAEGFADMVLAPVAQIKAMAAAAPPPARDADGEITAPACVVLLLNRAALRPGGAPAAEVTATAALLAWMRDATLRLGPRLRLNALALDPAAPGDLAPGLRWLTAADAVAGQLLGAARRGREAVAVCDILDSSLDPTSSLDLSTSGLPVTQR